MLTLSFIAATRYALCNALGLASGAGSSLQSHSLLISIRKIAGFDGHNHGCVKTLTVCPSFLHFRTKREEKHSTVHHFFCAIRTMSLGRVSYLESWEHHPPPFIRKQSFGDRASGDEESTHDHDQEESSEAEAAFLPSSFPSTFPHRTVRHKLSFNPYAGRGWTQSSAAETDDERLSLLGSDIVTGPNILDLPQGRVADENIATEAVFQDPKWDTAETTPAFEVNSGKRIGKWLVICLL